MEYFLTPILFSHAFFWYFEHDCQDTYRSIVRFYDTTTANRYVSWWYFNLVVFYSYPDMYRGIFSILIQRRYHTIPHIF
jgi:hypothetical protein